MEWLDNLAGGFAILVILSLILIVAGFLGDAAWRNGADPAPEPSRPSLYLLGVGWLLIAAAWSYKAFDEYYVDSVSWISFGFALAWAALATLLGLRHIRSGLRAD